MSKSLRQERNQSVIQPDLPDDPSTGDLERRKIALEAKKLEVEYERLHRPFFSQGGFWVGLSGILLGIISTTLQATKAEKLRAEAEAKLARAQAQLEGIEVSTKLAQLEKALAQQEQKKAQTDLQEVSKQVSMLEKKRRDLLASSEGLRVLIDKPIAMASEKSRGNGADNPITQAELASLVALRDKLDQTVAALRDPDFQSPPGAASQPSAGGN